jgi:hypothetical protein
LANFQKYFPVQQEKCGAKKVPPFLGGHAGTIGTWEKLAHN